MQLLTKQEKVAGLVVWLALTFFAAATGAAASIRASAFYGQLVRPDWAPPSWVFGPAWSILYTLMGIAAWLIWCTGGFRENKFALTIFLVQLAFNALWSWLFFGWYRGALAFADVILLLALIVVTLISFWRIKPLAGLLFVPYLFWVSFAAALNYSVWQLNPQVFG